MRTDTTTSPARRDPGAAVLVSLALACILTDVGMLAIGMHWGDFHSPGYHRIGDLGSAGFRVIGLAKPVFEWGLLAWLMTGGLLFHRILGKRKLRLRHAHRIGWILALVVLVVLPLGDGPAFTYYYGQGNSLEVSFQHATFPVFGYWSKSDIEDGPSDTALAGKTFLCTHVRQWNFFGIQLRREFYPTLDDKHVQQLLSSGCTEIGQTTARKHS